MPPALGARLVNWIMIDSVPPAGRPPGELLESWKEIATYLGKGVRTVVRWEKTEGLPVHRHLHERRSSVFAYKSEIDTWWRQRRAILEETPPASPPVRRIRWLWLAALAPVCAAAFWLLRPTPIRTPGLPLNFEPLTSYAGSQYAPSFSPDGSQFAFAWNGSSSSNTDIYIQAVGAAEPKRLTEHPHLEFSPAWSPDGRWIAFIRRSEQFHVEVLVVPSSGDGERKLANLGVTHFMDAPQLSWSPDGKWLAFADCDNGSCGIFSLAPGTGERRQLTKGQGWRKDLDPSFSPDGRHLAFRRGPSESHTEIHVQPLTADGKPAGEPEKLTDRGVRSTSPVWSGDGHQIFFSSGVYYSYSDLYRVQFHPRSSAPPERLTASSGEDHFSLAVSWRAGILAYTRKQADINIWAIEKEARGWMPPKPVQLLSSTRNDFDPDFSPDGEQIAFVSNRSGHPELWVSQRDGSRPRKLTSFRTAQIASPRWSPQGARISFSALWQDAYSVWVIDAGGGQPRKLAEPGWGPAWSHDGRWIYYSWAGQRPPRIFKIPAEGGDRAEVFTPGSLLSTSPDGRFLFFQGVGGVRRLPLQGGPTELVLKIEWFTPYVVRDDGVFFMGMPLALDKRRAILFHRFSDGVTSELATTGRDPSRGITVSPDGKTLLYSQTDHELTSLMFARGLW